MAMKMSGKFGSMNAAKKPQYNEEFNKAAGQAGYKKANEIGGIGKYLVKGIATGKGAVGAATADAKKEMAPQYRREALQKLAREKTSRKPKGM